MVPEFDSLRSVISNDVIWQQTYPPTILVVMGSQVAGVVVEEGEFHALAEVGVRSCEKSGLKSKFSSSARIALLQCMQLSSPAVTLAHWRTLGQRSHFE